MFLLHKLVKTFITVPYFLLKCLNWHGKSGPAIIIKALSRIDCFSIPSFAILYKIDFTIVFYSSRWMSFVDFSPCERTMKKSFVLVILQYLYVFMFWPPTAYQNGTIPSLCYSYSYNVYICNYSKSNDFMLIYNKLFLFQSFSSTIITRTINFPVIKSLQIMQTRNVSIIIHAKSTTRPLDSNSIQFT